MFIRFRVMLASIAILTFVVSTPAAAHTSIIQDALGDVVASAPGYLDIAQAKVTEQIGTETLFFQVVLAEPVPVTPVGFLGWNWFVDVPGGPAFPEYVVVVRFCSQTVQLACDPGPFHWESSLVNNLTGTRTNNAFSFSVDGATVKAFVDPALIGDPASFNWYAVTRNVPSGGGPAIDFAPDTGAVAFVR